MKFRTDADGFSWNDDLLNKEEKPQKIEQDYVSMPFTGLRSPLMPGQVLPLIVHEAGAYATPDRQSSLRQNYNAFVEKNTTMWGESSPHHIDWKALNAATHLLVEGVIAGDVNKVQEALQHHADPNMTVAVRDPLALSSDNSAEYVAMPVGVAAVLRGQEVAQSTGNKAAAAPFKEIGALLLMNGQTPRIEVGNNPNGDGGSAISYQAFGVVALGDQAGFDSIETRVVAIPLSVRTALGSVAPMAIVDNNVKPQTNGVVWGEEIPKKAAEYMDLIDMREAAFTDVLTRFRQRQAQQPAITTTKSGPKM